MPTCDVGICVRAVPRREEMVLYDYSDDELAEWAENIKHLLQETRDVYVFFNNDYKGYAPKNALTLMEMLS